jgi:hypothetical protein
VQAQAGTSAVTVINPADLYARENIAAQTGLSNDVTAIAAPSAGQSNWGVNLLGETLHYAPGVGWKIVAGLYGGRDLVNPTASSSLVIVPVTMPRAGFVTVAALALVAGVTTVVNDVFCSATTAVSGQLFYDRVYDISAQYNLATSGAATRVPVVAGQVINFIFRFNAPSATSWQYGWSFQYDI